MLFIQQDQRVQDEICHWLTKMMKRIFRGRLGRGRKGQKGSSGQIETGKHNKYAIVKKRSDYHR